MSRPLRIEDLIVWKLACEFEAGVLALLRASPSAARDFKFAAQLGDSASSVAANIAEGFYRYNAGEFAQFLRYSRGSLAEAEKWLQTGVRKGYWQEDDLRTWFAIAARLGPALRSLHNSLTAAAKRKKEERGGKGSEGGKGVSKVRE